MTHSSSNRERWAAVTDLFGRALEQPAEARDVFVREAAAGDDALIADVRSLLDAHTRAEGFMDKPAVATTIEARADVAALLAPGQAVGHYRIDGMLGEGGMGIVYLAHDTRLGRTVALKAIAPSVTGDATRAARLRREARAAAALSHPNIATIFALEEIDGHLYIGSEYVPGETLRTALAYGPLPLNAVRETALAMASALHAAHARGIVHRDLKPENIMRLPDGSVKILDFGLAQFHEGTPDSTDLTGDGGVIGTPGYMSPEQIRGLDLDGRSDLFALGVLLYELTSRIHPFAAATPVGTLARILQDEPTPLGAVVPASVSSTPEFAQIDALVFRCLRKSPDERVQSAADIPAILTGPIVTPPTAATPAQGAATSWPTPPAVIPPPDPRAMWWWQFHQAATTMSYALMMVPLWRMRHVTPVNGMGVWLFLLALAAVVIASSLRLHVWFAARQYPDAWHEQHGLARGWIRGADLVFALTLLVKGALASTSDDRAAGLLVACACAVAVSSVVVEPATTRAAFER